MGDLNVFDGIGVVWVLKYFGEKLYERVIGFDFMMFFMLEFEKKRVRVFLFGVKLGVVEKVKENLLK